MVSLFQIGTLLNYKLIIDGQSLQTKCVLNVKAPIGSFDGEKAILELLSDYCGNFEKFRCNLLW